MYSRQFESVRLDGLAGSSQALLLLLFAVSFPLAYNLGGQGPEVYLEKASEARYSNQNESRWVEDLAGLDRVNQEVTLRAELSNRRFAELGMVKPVEVDVTLWGSRGRDEQFTLLQTDSSHAFTVNCPRGSPLCDRVTLLHVPSVDWRTYRAVVSMRGLASENEGTVRYTFAYGNPQFSLVAMLVKYSFLVLTLQKALSYYYHVARETRGGWPAERRMVMLLAAGLVCLNDPLYMLRLVWGGFVFPLLALIGHVTFGCVALLYVLVTLDGYLQQLKVLTSPYEMEARVRVAPKAAVIGALWAAQCVVAVLVRLNQVEDPMYRASADMRGFVMYKAVSLCLAVVACWWYSYIVVRTLGEIADISRTVGVHTTESGEVRALRARFYFVAAISFLVFVAVAVSLVMWYTGIAGLPGNNAAEWVAFAVFFNLFGLILIHVMTPSAYTRLRGGDDDDL